MATSRKRKASDMETFYYGVQAGHTPGVYLTWAECRSNITGFKGASFKKFDSQQDAQDFVAGRVVAGMKKEGKDGKQRYYGVAVGHVPGVYEEWTDAQLQVQGVKGPKFKKFETRAEAEEFVRSGGKKVAEVKRGTEDGPEKKKIKVKEKEKKGDASGLVRVYTDGSSRGNGKVGAVAGVGVYFGVDDPRNVSEPLQGQRQTNQRAELTGILRALEIVPSDKPMEIITDSNYSINCSTEWYKNWIRHDWKTSTGKVVENKDLVQAIRKLIDGRGRVLTKFTWIKGHNDDPGNEAADRLAVAGAMARR